ncbi:hypothetical protein HELRODRAFT_193921 [Helobdella robusta]|uniref:Sushi domain-containing protein n=1 Tax=Helobdella robusta TaxID=6412 RepID=T1FVH2_HELRO|nr:hypothetical protein HELRODRAFT_193921 [Helobdella robusta]ESN93699.1 hypothetical protein HELRODRAFT_193921 [Helobdella robusta]
MNNDYTGRAVYQQQPRFDPGPEIRNDVTEGYHLFEFKVVDVEGNSAIFVTCPGITPPPIGDVTCDNQSHSLLYGTRCSLSCPTGYGNSGQPVECQRNGSWSGYVGHCKVLTCHDPSTPLHSTRHCTHPRHGTHHFHRHETTCYYTCLPGYRLTGNSSSIQCLATEFGRAEWTHAAPTCQRIIPPIINNCPKEPIYLTSFKPETDVYSPEVTFINRTSGRKIDHVCSHFFSSNKRAFPIGQHNITCHMTQPEVEGDDQQHVVSCKYICDDGLVYPRTFASQLEKFDYTCSGSEGVWHPFPFVPGCVVPRIPNELKLPVEIWQKLSPSTSAINNVTGIKTLATISTKNTVNCASLLPGGLTKWRLLKKSSFREMIISESKVCSTVQKNCLIEDFTVECFSDDDDDDGGGGVGGVDGGGMGVGDVVHHGHDDDSQKSDRKNINNNDNSSSSSNINDGILRRLKKNVKPSENDITIYNNNYNNKNKKYSLSSSSFQRSTTKTRHDNNNNAVNIYSKTSSSRHRPIRSRYNIATTNKIRQSKRSVQSKNAYILVRFKFATKIKTQANTLRNDNNNNNSINYNNNNHNRKNNNIKEYTIENSQQHQHQQQQHQLQQHQQQQQDNDPMHIWTESYHKTVLTLECMFKSLQRLLKTEQISIITETKSEINDNDIINNNNSNNIYNIKVSKNVINNNNIYNNNKSNINNMTIIKHVITAACDFEYEYYERYLACVPCGSGTYYNTSRGKCVPCPTGRIQPEEAKFNCIYSHQ